MLVDKNGNDAAAGFHHFDGFLEQSSMGVLDLAGFGNGIAGPFWVVYAVEQIGLSSMEWGLILLVESALRMMFAPVPAPVAEPPMVAWLRRIRLVDSTDRSPALPSPLELMLMLEPSMIVVVGFSWMYAPSPASRATNRFAQHAAPNSIWVDG